MTTLALFGPTNMFEMIILAAIGLLIFGRRMPEVGKNLGRGIVEFKKGLAGIDDEVNKPAMPRSDAPKTIEPPPATRSVEDLQAENARLRAQLADKSQHNA